MDVQSGSAGSASGRPDLVSFGVLLRHSATIPCLSLLADGPRAQRDVVERLRSHFAPNTVVDSLEALVGQGLVVRRRGPTGARRVEYECTHRGREIANLPVKAFVDALPVLPPIREPDDGGVKLRMD